MEKKINAKKKRKQRKVEKKKKKKGESWKNNEKIQKNKIRMHYGLLF